MRKPQHQEQRAEHPPEQHDKGEPREVCLLQRGLDIGKSNQATAPMNDGETKSGSQVQDTRQQPWINRSHQQFG